MGPLLWLFADAALFLVFLPADFLARLAGAFVFLPGDFFPSDDDLVTLPEGFLILPEDLTLLRERETFLAMSSTLPPDYETHVESMRSENTRTIRVSLR